MQDQERRPTPQRFVFLKCFTLRPLATPNHETCVHVNHKDVWIHDDKCELNLWRTQYGGNLTFHTNKWDMKKNGKITITQANVQKKAAIWWLLEPYTYECQERPAKRRRGKPSGPYSSSPSQNFY